MFVELLLFCVHSFHIHLSILYLAPGTINILIVFLGMMDTIFLLILLNIHTLSPGLEQTAEDVETVAYSGAAVLD
jgi:hypothetical protein